MKIHHDAYDKVIDNDWSTKPVVRLYTNGPRDFDDIVKFALWCSKFVGKLKVSFPDKGVVHIRKT